MKKKSEPSYILIFVASFILASLLLSEKYGVYHSLPSLRFFYIPGEPSAGDLFYEFFRWNLSLSISFLICYLISKISKNDMELSDIENIFKDSAKILKKYPEV